jgi:hypothetical protein
MDEDVGSTQAEDTTDLGVADILADNDAQPNHPDFPYSKLGGRILRSLAGTSGVGLVLNS